MTQTTDFDNINSTLTNLGIEKSVKITDTLQGSIWRASFPSNNAYKDLIVKATNRHQHNHSICVIDNRSIRVKENILLEQHILKSLTIRKDCPLSIVKFHGFYLTNSHFYLVMENGGLPLFDFIKCSHTLIKHHKIDLNEWRKVVKIIFKQLLDCIDYIHSLNICHNDISLENLLINDVNVEVLSETNSKIQFVKTDIQIKICDFGLAECHFNTDCLSTKHCGKTQYKSPEVMDEKPVFDGKKNDIWCIGVCLFMMIFGFPPWRMAHISDETFNYIMNGNMDQMLSVWNVMGYVDDDKDLMDLFECVFRYEEDRVSLDVIKKNPWLQV